MIILSPIVLRERKETSKKSIDLCDLLLSAQLE